MKISIKNLSFSYKEKCVLQNINLEIQPKEILAIIGANGSGKTTLLRSISGLQKIDSGSVYLDMKDLATMKPREIAQYLAALEPEIQTGFDYSTFEIVSMGRIAFSTSTQENKRIVRECMIQTGVWEFAKKSIFQLSSGEKQRVWLAMALAQQPKILLLDEPTSYLDIKYQLQILHLLQDLIKHNIAVVCTIHDLNLVAQFATKLAIMKEGKLVVVGRPAEVLTPLLLRENFGIEAHIIKENKKVLGLIPRL